MTTKKKLTIRFGTWNNAALGPYAYTRVWLRGYIWTPFVFKQPRYKGIIQ